MQVSTQKEGGNGEEKGRRKKKKKRKKKRRRRVSTAKQSMRFSHQLLEGLICGAAAVSWECWAAQRPTSRSSPRRRITRTICSSVQYDSLLSWHLCDRSRTHLRWFRAGLGLLLLWSVAPKATPIPSTHHRTSSLLLPAARKAEAGAAAAREAEKHTGEPRLPVKLGAAKPTRSCAPTSRPPPLLPFAGGKTEDRGGQPQQRTG